MGGKDPLIDVIESSAEVTSCKEIVRRVTFPGRRPEQLIQASSTQLRSAGTMNHRTLIKTIFKYHQRTTFTTSINDQQGVLAPIHSPETI